MDFMSLPFPAFQSAVHQMAEAAGLHKAVRLRLVCKEFDKEVCHAIYDTHLFELVGDGRASRMCPASRARRIRGIVKRPHHFPKNQLVPAIHHHARKLSGGTNISKEYLENEAFLCQIAGHALSANNIDRLLDGIIPSSTMFNGERLKISPGKNDELAIAAAFGLEDRVDGLLNDSVDQRAGSRHFGHPMDNAIRGQHMKIVRRLLRQPHGLDRRILDSAIESAAAVGRQDILELVIQSRREKEKADLNHASVVAASHGQAKLTRILVLQSLLHREPPHSKDEWAIIGCCLTRAAGRGYLNVVKKLLDMGLPIDKNSSDGSMPLAQAAKGGHARVVKYLLNHGADVQCKMSGATPLYLAAKNGHCEVVRILLDHGADMHPKGCKLHIFAQAAEDGEMSIMRILLRQGLDLSNPLCGLFALELAAEKGHDHIVRMLVELGVDVNGLHPGRQDSPMIGAMLCEQDAIVKLLLELGANKVDDSDSRLPNKSKWNGRSLLRCHLNRQASRLIFQKRRGRGLTSALGALSIQPRVATKGDERARGEYTNQRSTLGRRTWSIHRLSDILGPSENE